MTQLATTFTSAKKYFRPLVLIMAFIVGFIALFYKAWNLQIRQHEEFQKKAVELNRAYIEEKLYAPRGAIYARSELSSGTRPVLLADSETLYTLYLYPPTIQKSKNSFTNEAIHELANILQMDEGKIKGATTLTKTSFTLARELSEKQKEDISSNEKLKQNIVEGCIKLIPTPKRRYPHNPLAKSVIGSLTMDQKALSGIELKFDSYLMGKTESASEIRLPRSAKENMVVLLSDNPLILPQPGNDVYLTIHERMQTELERTLQDGIEKLKENNGMTQGIEGTAIAMDIKTGAVLAITSQNQLFTDPAEHGSVIKPFTVAAALEEGIIKPDDEWNCENGKWYIPGMPATEKPIVDAERHSILTTTQCLSYSSNICMAKISRKLGKEKLYNFFKKVGFGAQTSTDFSGERAGLVPPLQQWDDKTFATISFGQGMTSTPLQVVAGIAAFANGGIYNKPYLVEKIVSPSGQMVYEAVPETRRLVSEATATTVSKMMRAVMGKKGTGQGFDLADYPLACKTGTAQRVNPKVKKKGYDRRFWTASLVCFGPYAPRSKLVEPRLAVGVFLSLDFSSLDLQGENGEDKIPTHVGAQTAGPITRDAMEKLLTIMRVPPVPKAPFHSGRNE